MKKLLLITALALAFSLPALAQSFTNLTSFTNFLPGKLVVYRGGNGSTNYTIVAQRQHPAFLDEFDPDITNQAAPILSAALPTNDVQNTMFFNAHAGSEGQGLTRSADRQYLALTGYTSPINESAGTPSGTNAFNRGFGLIDSLGNFGVVYSSQNWYGIQLGITQNNPRGIATDGTNSFWGAGTIAGTQTGGLAESGTLFWNSLVSPDPELVQSIINSSYYTKIVNGVLYMVAKNEAGGASANGIYNFVDLPDNGGAPVPLPWIPDGVQHIVTTNLFLNFGATYSKILTFDMNLSRTIVYAADTTAGIVKFVNTAGTWSSPYIFGSTNLGTATQPKGGTGCFGVAVDFSGPNPIIYATTMEEGDGNNTCSNRLIRIVDNGNPGTNLVAETLAVAGSINEVFRGLDFTPDLRPLITLEPADAATTNGGSATFTVAANSITNLTYQWQQNGTNLLDQTNTTLTFNNLATNFSGNAYQCVVSNIYGAVTSAPPAILTVTFVATAPSLTNAVIHQTNFIGDNVSFSVNPNGTTPFTYQWYFGNILLTDDGVKYSGSTNSTLSITNVQLGDSGNYSVTVSNAVGGISNLVVVLTVQFVLPGIADVGQPASITMLQGQTNSLTVSDVTGTEPLTYQWYQGDTLPVTPLSDTNEFSGTATNTLTISGASIPNDATNYFCVISNAGGSVTSQVASVTVIIPPAPSFVAYTNQIYTQNFDSLPGQGGTNVNTIGGGGAVTINGVTYSPANPFDFAQPVYINISGGESGGLGLSNTMAGWYGECDADGQGAQLGASDGSQTTGGVISFGSLNSSERALGLIATSTSGGTHFGLKLVNQTATNLNFITLQFVGEYWKSGTKPKTLSFGYSIDPAGPNSAFSTGEISAATNNTLTNLSFNFPTSTVGAKDGNLATNQTNLAAFYMPLNAPWQPGSALWLVWSINDATGSGQGYGIDNLSFYASTTNLPAAIITPTLNGATYTSANAFQFSFNNVPGASASFTIWGTTDIALPFNQWLNLGHPVETSPGSYQFQDALAGNSPNKFYRVTVP